MKAVKLYEQSVCHTSYRYGVVVRNRFNCEDDYIKLYKYEKEALKEARFLVQQHKLDVYVIFVTDGTMIGTVRWSTRRSRAKLEKCIPRPVAE
jgi:hypothetical protein